MSHLLSFAPGWNLDVPAGTFLVRADIVMNTRPGAGGYCAILEASDLPDIILLRGAQPATDTASLLKLLSVRLADEIGRNRAVVVVRTPLIQQQLAGVFKPYKMIRFLGNSPLAVADATRHAAVMAERGLHRSTLGPSAAEYMQPVEERLLTARFQPRSEEFHEGQDSSTLHAAMNDLLGKIGVGDLSRPEVQKAAQAVLDAAEQQRIVQQQDAIRKLTANDIPRVTKERKLAGE
jgi:hypothetical protein